MRISGSLCPQTFVTAAPLALILAMPIGVSKNKPICQEPNAVVANGASSTMTVTNISVVVLTAASLNPFLGLKNPEFPEA